MRVQCPPCGTRYSVGERRFGADGRALSRCINCGTWLVVSRLDSAQVEIRTADELVGKRSVLALDYSDWNEDVSERATMPMGVQVGDVNLPSAYGARHADTNQGELADLMNDEEVGFDTGEAHEGTDPGIGETLSDSGGVAPVAPTTLKSHSPETPTAMAAPEAKPAVETGPRAASDAEELPESAFLVAPPKPGFFPTADDDLEVPLPGPKPELGALDMDLPDPRRRRRSRVEVQQMLTEFSVMFRLDTRVRRRRTLMTTGIVVLICATIVAFVALRAGNNVSEEAVQMRTLATSLHATHSLGVPHHEPATDGSGKTSKRLMSMLATQLRQLHKTAPPPAKRADGELRDGEAPAPVGPGK